MPAYWSAASDARSPQRGTLRHPEECVTRRKDHRAPWAFDPLRPTHCEHAQAGRLERMIGVRILVRCQVTTLNDETEQPDSAWRIVRQSRLFKIGDQCEHIGGDKPAGIPGNENLTLIASSCSYR